MSSIKIEVDGFDELKSKIIQLANDKDKKKEMLLILRQVARPTLQAAKNATPVSKRSHIARGKRLEPGTLKKSQGLITSKSDNPTILVGPRVKGNNDGWYGHIVHSGHDVYNNASNIGKTLKSGKRKSVLARITNKRKGNSVGYVQGIPFMDIAYEQTKTSVTADAENKMSAFIQRRINKLSS